MLKFFIKSKLVLLSKSLSEKDNSLGSSLLKFSSYVKEFNENKIFHNILKYSQKLF